MKSLQFYVVKKAVELINDSFGEKIEMSSVSPHSPEERDDWQGASGSSWVRWECSGSAAVLLGCAHTCVCSHPAAHLR